MTQPLQITELELTRKENPTRWEGADSEGRYIQVRYRFYRLRIETEGAILWTKRLPCLHPGATYLSLTPAGLKQAIFDADPAIWLPF